MGDSYGKYGYGKSLGDGYGKSSFSFFLDIFPFGKWLREMVTGSLCIPLFLDISPFGGWLREMVTGSLCFPFFLHISPCGLLLLGGGCGLREMVTGDGYGKSLFSSFS